MAKRSKFLTFLKVIAIIYYSMAWIMVEFFVLFIVQIMPPPWKLFKTNKSCNTNVSNSDHNWDKDYTDLEYYDMVDDD